MLATHSILGVTRSVGTVLCSYALISVCVFVLLLHGRCQPTQRHGRTIIQHRHRQVPSLRGVFRQPNANCVMSSLSYTPSQLEQAWSSNITRWDDFHEFCQHAEQFRVRAYSWIDAVLANAASKVHPELNPDIFSCLNRTYACGSRRDLVYIHQIEPLAFALRHPLAVCFGADLRDPDYVVLATKAEVEQQRTVFPCIRRPCQSMMVHLGGAGIWRPNALGEVGQAWFENAYKARGIEFDRFLLWESQPVAANDVFKDLPPNVWHKYQYYNLPQSPDDGSLASPFQIIKTIAQLGDFVAVRLTGDGDYKLTETMLDTLLADDELVGLIDEFFYEDRVDFDPLSAHWNGSAHPLRSLYDSYEIFADLRIKGVRAHAFV
jgi:hypothetical protein